MLKKSLKRPEVFDLLSLITNFLSLYCIEYGPNLATNSRLLAIVASAKKLGFPKASIDSAIARGQGISIDGSALESLTIEAMMPPAIAFIIECQTDSKARTLQDLRQVLKDFKASMTPTMYMFEKKGKIVFERNRDLEDDRILEEAIDAGAVDIEFGEDEIVVYADPTNTRVIAETLGSSLSMKAESSDVIWGPKEDARVTIDSSRTAETLEVFKSPFPLQTYQGRKAKSCTRSVVR